MEEIWNSYKELFYHENLVVSIGAVIATIAVLTFIINFVLKPLFTQIWRAFAKIRVTLGMSHQIAQDIVGTSVLPPLITVTITNRDRITRYIQNPLFKTSKKIDGENYFVVPKSKRSFPKKLEPGEQLTLDFDSMLLYNQILKYLKSKNKIGIIVRDTTGKHYKSNKFTVGHITGHSNVANQLNRE